MSALFRSAPWGDNSHMARNAKRIVMYAMYILAFLGILFYHKNTFTVSGGGESSSSTTQFFLEQPSNHRGCETSRKSVFRAFDARDAVLGAELLFAASGMGDISTAEGVDQIKAYSMLASKTWVKTVCEIAFAVGTSTITYLESNPHVRVITFDTMEMMHNASYRPLYACAFSSYMKSLASFAEAKAMRALIVFSMLDT